MKKAAILFVIFLLVSPLFVCLMPEVKAVPSLSSGYVTPSSGPSTTQFHYYVTYYDSGGLVPELKTVNIDGDSRSPMTLYSGTPSNGVYHYSTTLSVGTHTYYFMFTAGSYTLYLPPPSTPYSGPIVNPPQHMLTVYSAHDSPNPPNGNWYFNDGQLVTCSVTSPVTEGCTLWTCTGWTGTGSVPSSGSSTLVTFPITQDSTITWNWQGSQATYTLTVYSAHDSPVPGNGPHTYNCGQSVTCSVTSPVIEGSTEWVCTGWSGTGSVPSSDGSASVTFTMAQDSTITWNWQEVVPPNDPPSAPVFSLWSPTLFISVEMEYGASAIDPDDDDVSITFYWGDETQDTEGPASSGSFLSHSHSWSNTGMYEVRARATDEHGVQSDWSVPVEVTVLTNIHENIWAGYMVQSTSQSITSVEGHFYVPSFGTEKYGIHGIWVGIGGNGPSVPLLQAGVEAVTHSDTGETFYCAFVERDPNRLSHYLYEDNPSKSGAHINAGDEIRVSISALPTPSEWTIEIEDITRSWTLTFPSITWSNPDQTTAEWIFEPGAGHTNMPSSFGTVVFSMATLEIDSTSYEMGKVGHQLDVNLYKCVCVRDDVTITYTTPIESYKNFEISDTGTRPAPPPPVPITSLTLFSSAELHVYDSLGNHLGLNSTTGVLDVEIPRSFFFEDEGIQYVLLFNTDAYQISLLGTGDGDFHLRTQIISNETITLDQWTNDTIIIDETKTYALIHQISLESLNNLKTVIGEGYNNTVTVVVANNGNYTEALNLTLYLNSTAIRTQLVTLEGDNLISINLTWSTNGIEKSNYTVSVTADAVPGETDTSDNSVTGDTVLVTIPGDINGDRWVNAKDAIALGMAFYPSGEYNPNADINGDGYCNAKDAIILGIHFNEHWE